MVNVGPLAAEIVSLFWGTPANFNCFASWLRYCSDVAQRNQRNFARCLAVSCDGTRYIHFRGLLPRNGILPGAKFILRPSLALSCIGSVTARYSSSGHWASAKLCGVQQTVPTIFGRAAITLDIGAHSSSIKYCYCYCNTFASIVKSLQYYSTLYPNRMCKKVNVSMCGIKMSWNVLKNVRGLRTNRTHWVTDYICVCVCLGGNACVRCVVRSTISLVN